MEFDPETGERISLTGNVMCDLAYAHFLEDCLQQTADILGCEVSNIIPTLNKLYKKIDELKEERIRISDPNYLKFD